MSRRCAKKEVEYRPMVMPPVSSGNCCCNFPSLVILILIVLQFSRSKGGYGEDGEGCGRHGGVGNGILFIIALFFLACCNPCKPGITGGLGGFGGFGGGCCGA